MKEASAGLAIPELMRKHGISEWTLYRWRKKYGGLEVAEARRLKAFEEENRRLKHVVADLSLEVRALKAMGETKSERAGATRLGQDGAIGYPYR